MKKISVILIVALFMVTFAGVASADSYRVRPGDNLYSIGQKVGINHNVIMATNNLDNALIRPGQVINIPGEKGSYYQVQEGDNLFRISKKYNVSVKEILKTNNLDNTLIFPGQKLLIPGKGETLAEPAISGTVKSMISNEDIELLARLIHAEARGEDYLGQLAVGAVILNRMASNKFPDSIKEVIYQRTKGGYQFTPVGNGSIKLRPDSTARKAAREAIQGHDPTDGALFFYNPNISTDQWIKTLPVTKRIGNHVFAK